MNADIFALLREMESDMGKRMAAALINNSSTAFRPVRGIGNSVAALLLAVFAMAYFASPAPAIDAEGLVWNRVSLTCWIENEKVIAVVNSTGKTLPGGTKLSVDAVRLPDGSHFRKTTTLGRTPSGGIIRIGAVPSSSCTASARLPMPVLKTQ